MPLSIIFDSTVIAAYVFFLNIFSFFFCVFPEANPEKFNSRFRNKMFYAGVSVPLELFHTHRKSLLREEGELGGKKERE